MSVASSAERYMLQLINQERVAYGLNPVQLELRLNTAADNHNLWMEQTDTFSHTGVGRSSPSDRAQSAGFPEGVAENIAWQSERGDEGILDDVDQLHQGLMNSPGHRANILNPNHQYVGIGIEEGDFRGYEAVLVTQKFASTDAPVQLDTGSPSPVPDPNPQPVPNPDPDPHQPQPKPTPNPAPTPDEPPVSTGSFANEAECFMLQLINEERTAYGLDPVQLELRLNAAAEDHSIWMDQANTFSHTGAGRSSPSDRAQSAGFPEGVAENIAWQSERGTEGIMDDVVQLHQSLMNSPGHRANILNPNHQYVGIGIEEGNLRGYEAVIVTQKFASTDQPVQLDTGSSDPVPQPNPEPSPDPVPDPNGNSNTTKIEWGFGTTTVISDFDPATDIFDFHRFSARQVDVDETSHDLVFELAENGGRRYEVKDTQAEDLSLDNFIAAPGNPLLDPTSPFIQDLASLGFEY